jgi:transitional endoplasmic reticulum ATPase
MPLVAVDLKEIADSTLGFAPADMKGLCQQAALMAMRRQDMIDSSSNIAAVIDSDFQAALAMVRRGIVGSLYPKP